jgi:hypothetical protein
MLIDHVRISRGTDMYLERNVHVMEREIVNNHVKILRGTCMGKWIIWRGETM